MISALAMCRAAWTANCIISTAPIAKFGAMNTLALAPFRSLELGGSKPGGPDHDVHAGVDGLARVGHGAASGS